MELSKSHEEILLELMFNLYCRFSTGGIEVMASTNDDWETLELCATIWKGEEGLSYSLRRAVRNPLFLSLFNHSKMETRFSILEDQNEIQLSIRVPYTKEDLFKELLEDFTFLCLEWGAFLNQTSSSEEACVRRINP